MKYYTLLGLFALSPIANAVYAQANNENIEKLTVTGDRFSNYRYSEIDGASPLNLDIKDTPQSISIVGEKQIADFALNDVSDVLNTVTGVNVEEIETDRTYFTARGFDITNFQVDGLGLPVISGNTHGSLDTAFYERVEVVRGANGLMTGVGNPSATINLVRKKPAPDQQLMIRAQYGSWDNKRVDVDASLPLSENWAARAVVASQSQDSYLDRYGRDKTMFYGIVEGAIGKHTQLSVGASRQKSQATGNMWGALTLYYDDGTPTNFDTSTNIAANWSAWDVTDTRYFATVSHDFSSDWVLDANYMHVTTDEDSNLFYVYQSIDADTGLGLRGYGSRYVLNDDHDYADLRLSGKFNALGRRHDVVFGVNYGDVGYTDRSYYDNHTGKGYPEMPPLDEFDGNLPFPEFTDTSDASASDVDTRQVSYYAATNLSLTDDLNLILGGRANDVDVDGMSYDVDQSTDESAFVPYAGLVYAVNENINLYTSYTETFQVQTEVDENFNLLGPVTGESTEIGMKTSLFDDSALLTLTWFNVKQDNLAVSAGEVVNPATGVPEQVHRGATGIESEGWELDIAGELLPGLNTNLGVTIFDIDGDDLVENYTPEKLITLTGSYAFPTLPQLEVGASVRWQDDISREQGQIDGVPFYTTQDSYTLVNLMANYRINKQWTITANVNNLTDQKYLNSLYWAQGFYGAPRNYMVSVSWRF